MGQTCVQRQMTVLAVHRHEVLRPYEAEDKLQLFLRRVAPHVDVLRAVVEHVGAV